MLFLALSTSSYLPNPPSSPPKFIFPSSLYSLYYLHHHHHHHHIAVITTHPQNPPASSSYRFLIRIIISLLGKTATYPSLSPCNRPVTFVTHERFVFPLFLSPRFVSSLFKKLAPEQNLYCTANRNDNS